MTGRFIRENAVGITIDGQIRGSLEAGGDLGGFTFHGDIAAG